VAKVFKTKENPLDRGLTKKLSMEVYEGERLNNPIP
tara:strand:- start:569 stop:676 length:108 start_codon:yes stop_codon:yes gene_type:complete